MDIIAAPVGYLFAKTALSAKILAKTYRLPLLDRDMTPEEREHARAVVGDRSYDSGMRFWMQGKLAQQSFRDSVARYAERNGKTYVDWHAGRAAALEEHRRRAEQERRAFEEKRRRDGDAEIMVRAEELAAAYRKARAARLKATKGAAAVGEGKSPSATGTPASGLLITPERLPILAEVLERCHTSSRYYASRTSVAAASGAGEATVQRFIAELERAGVLVRLRTGGLRADGSRATNRYTLDHNRLRELLGIENRWASKYDGDYLSRVFLRPVNPYFSGEGYAHCSKSERQARRLRARARAAAGVVENPRAASANEQNRRSHPADTVTALLKNQKTIRPLTKYPLEQALDLNDPIRYASRSVLDRISKLDFNSQANLSRKLKLLFASVENIRNKKLMTALVNGYLSSTLCAENSPSSKAAPTAQKTRIEETSVSFGPAAVKGVEVDPC